MKIIDISWPITPEMTAYKDKRIVAIRATKTFAKEGVRESEFVMGSHTGTHVDAPAHFLEKGGTLDAVPLGSLIGRCIVLDMTHVSDGITAADCMGLPDLEGMIVLLKTRNSFRANTAPFDYENVYVDYTAAEYLVEKKVKAIGIDYLGIERNQPDHATHLAFMKAEKPIIEGLRLANVEAGFYFFVCLPLNIGSADGAPARAILIEGMGGY